VLGLTHVQARLRFGPLGLEALLHVGLMPVFPAVQELAHGSQLQGMAMARPTSATHARTAFA
jgi:hypothetical protein